MASTEPELSLVPQPDGVDLPPGRCGESIAARRESMLNSVSRRAMRSDASASAMPSFINIGDEPLFVP